MNHGCAKRFCPVISFKPVCIGKACFGFLAMSALNGYALVWNGVFHQFIAHQMAQCALP